MACLRIEADGFDSLRVWHFPASPSDWEGVLIAKRWKGSKHLTVRNMPRGNYYVSMEGPYYPIVESKPGSDWEPSIRYFAGTESEKIRPNLKGDR